MKKVFKSKIFIIILSAIILCSGTALAYSIIANDVGFTPADSSWKDKDGNDIENVKEALDDLHFELKERKVYCVRLTGDKKTRGSK